MARKPGSMYRYQRGMPTTRREYMGGIPASRITQFDMGNKTVRFQFCLSLRANEACQIRHLALEAARVTAIRSLEKFVGKSNFHLRIHVYPHSILRENKQATGAGADRISQGMSQSFGRTVGTAARVYPHQVIMSVETSEYYVDLSKRALQKAYMKLPTPCTITMAENT